jgi:hypothetical protein
MQFDKAKRFWLIRALVHLGIAATTVVSLFSSQSKLTAALAGLALALQLTAWLLTLNVSSAKAKAEECGRLLFLSYGFGVDPHELGGAQLLEIVEPSHASNSRASYGFYCHEQNGYAALLRTIQEMSFYLSWLNNRCREIMIAILAAMLVLTLTAFVVIASSLPQSINGNTIATASRIAIAVIALALSLQLSESLGSFSKAADAFTRIDAEVDLLLHKKTSEDNLHRASLWKLALWFFSVFERSPLIPWRVHQANRTRLLDRWKLRPHHAAPIHPHR